MSNKLFKKEETKNLLYLLLLALILRLFLLHHTYVIAKDGVIYISLGRYFAAGDFTRGLGHFFPPLYPLLIATVSLLIRNFELSGQLISVAFGSLTVVPVYLLTKSLINLKAGFLAAFFTVFHPLLVRYSGEVLAESIYIFLFVSALYFIWRALRSRRLPYFFFTGIFAALAYLTRPEGLGLLVLVFFWLFFLVVSGDKSSLSLRKAALALSLLLLPAILLAFPYICYMKAHDTEWKLTRKVDIFHRMGLREYLRKEPLAQKEATVETPTERWVFDREKFFRFWGEYVRISSKTLLHFADVLHPALFLLLLFSFLKRRGPVFVPRANAFVFSAFLLYLSVFSLIGLSHRHLTQLVPVALPWMALGILRLNDLIYSRIIKKRQRPFISKEKLLLILMVAVTIIILPKTLSPQRKKKLILKEAGLSLKEKGLFEPVIVGNLPRLSYYAGGRHIEADDHASAYPPLIQKARFNGADYIVMEKTEESEPFFEAIDPRDLKFVRRFSQKEKTLLIYELKR